MNGYSRTDVSIVYEGMKKASDLLVEIRPNARKFGNWNAMYVIARMTLIISEQLDVLMESIENEYELEQD